MKRSVSALRGAVALAAVLGAILYGPTAARADSVSNGGERALGWVAAQQQADGGFSNGFSKGSDVGTTADAVHAFAAGGQSPASVKSKSGKTPLDFLAAQVNGRKPLTIGQYAKIALAVDAAGQNPNRFGGKNLAALILKGYNDKTGVIGDNVYIHSLAMLALANAGAAIPAKAATTLESFQAPNGGWAFMGSGDPDVDTTALAAQALIAAGRPVASGAVGRALGYLRSIQNADGGFPYQVPSIYGTDTNANSTALATQAILAGGVQPESWAAPKGNPLSALLSLQNASGALSYQTAFPSDNIVATAGAIPAMFRVSLIGK